jgi:hypothetical protein
MASAMSAMPASVSFLIVLTILSIIILPLNR